MRADLFAPEREGYSKLIIDNCQLIIKGHPEFEAFASRTLTLYTDWYAAHADTLKGIAPEDKPKALIATLSEDLLHRFTEADLLDRYDIYQILMDYWAETMQDDVYVLVQDGWAAGKTLRELVVKKGEKLKETPDLTLGKKKYKADLIPPGLMVARYFADKQAHIDELQADLDGISQELEALMEEHSGEEGLLAEAQTDKGSVTKGSVSARLKEIKGDPDAEEERAMLEECRKLYDQEAAMKKAVKQATEALEQAVFGQYPQLSEAEVKTLVVEDKWHATLKGAIAAEIERVTQQLANRVKDLEERYAVTPAGTGADGGGAIEPGGGAFETDGVGMGLTHYRLSSHGLQEMARRGVLRQVVVDILAQPEQVVPGRDNRTIYQSRWDSEEGKTYLVRVVVDEQIDPPVVITVYRTSKVQKYWRAE
jgi:type I restriction enzyme M protein